MNKPIIYERPTSAFSHTANFYTHASDLDTYIEQLHISAYECEQLLLHIINLVDCAIQDAFLEGIRYAVKLNA